MAQADIALIGLAVMGQNLILNMNDHGFVDFCPSRSVLLIGLSPKLMISWPMRQREPKWWVPSP
ncbi:PGD isoform 9 [Pan troglodytes]|uniref:Phosphogluconate dehydrogenase n=2 Tax=Homininae TaxID=207598 RepID=K7EJT3_HUMAN|nr:phosphogluconate dehydrogenase [Homo sapiens]KAI4078551.1 phosphogluconate dehydrogenase [Homo sapiens]PNI39771.1 PGD isoform 9 [Pan troglodytes]